MIEINIINKRAAVIGTPVIVCGNSGYSIEFTFDEEWATHTDRTARFVYTKKGKNEYKDVPFTGSTVAVPVLSGIREVSVGVYAGDLQTTTPARIPCVYSILCNSGEDVTTGEDNPTLQEQVNANTAAIEDLKKNGTGTPGAGGLTATASNLLITILRNGVYSTDQSANITALAEALTTTEPDEPVIPDVPVEPDEPEVTLTSISATYSGGDVAVGTAVTALTGIVVTAHYSDGTSETVTDYTLSGTIAEGSNTVTVSYGGKTTTFAVAGVAESGGVVAMTAPMNEGSDTQYIYSDDGTTELKEPWEGRYYQLSEKTFEEDTEVEIRFAFSGILSGRQLFACSFDGTHHYYAVELGTVGENPTGTYTVKAGYRLSVVQNANNASQGVATVTEV